MNKLDRKTTDKTQRLLNHAKAKNIITERQFDELIQLNAELFGKQNLATATLKDDTPKFVLSHLLYYFGGLIAIGAMTLFMTLGFDSYGSVGVMLISGLYAVFGAGVVYWLHQKNLLTPYSIVLGFLLCLVPLFMFALQDSLGLWQEYDHYRDYHSWISVQWLILEISTLIVGAVMMWRFKRSFVMLPISITLWYLSMDIVPLLTQDAEWFDWELRKLVSLYFGLLMLVGAIWVDFRQHHKMSGQDFAFWLYIIGVMTFWGGLSLQESDSELAKFMYCMINVAMMITGIVLRRRVFAVFGGFGVAGYLGYLAYDVFEDSMIFPLVLALIGFAVIAFGVFWQKHEEKIYQKLLSLLPNTVQQKLLNLYE